MVYITKSKRNLFTIIALLILLTVFCSAASDQTNAVAKPNAALPRVTESTEMTNWRSTTNQMWLTLQKRKTIAVFRAAAEKENYLKKQAGLAQDPYKLKELDRQSRELSERLYNLHRSEVGLRLYLHLDDKNFPAWVKVNYPLIK